MEVNVCTPKTLTVLGVEYQVVRQLGMGSYAQVFEVVRVHDGVRLAAKCIDQGPLSTWARKQLVCEVEIQQSLQHPSILRMHAAGEDAASGKYVSIQDVAYGGELFERIMEQSSFVEDDARRVIAQLLAAVEHMHSRGVLHRDLKPENILLESRPDLGLGFGLGLGSARVPTLTLTGARDDGQVAVGRLRARGTPATLTPTVTPPLIPTLTPNLNPNPA